MNRAQCDKTAHVNKWKNASKQMFAFTDEVFQLSLPIGRAIDIILYRVRRTW